MIKIGGRLKKYIVLVTTIIFLFSYKISAKWTNELRDYFNATAPSVGMSFLKIGMGARAISLGGAYSSIVKDPTAVYWNPAAVIYTEGMDVSFSHLSLMEDIRYEFIAISSGDKNQGIGIGMGGLFYGGMELRDENPSEEPVGTFDAYSFLVKLSYGHTLGSDLIGGVSIGGIFERIYVYSTHSYTFDFGIRYFPNIIKPVEFSLNVNNLGPKIKYLDETYRLPFTTKLGCSYKIRMRNTDLIITTEISKSIDSPLSSAVGLETSFSFLSIRFGYSFNEKSALGWASGLGIKYKFLSIDYSVSPYLMDLGIRQAVSLTFDL